VTADRTGALLLNLGTPDSPSVPDVRRYLAEFLSDPLVIDIPTPLRWLLVHGIILRTRPPISAAAYAKVWTAEGSPLLLHSRALTEAVAAEIGPDWVVELGMRYGKPSIADALTRIANANVSRLVVLPLFPQYSKAATESALLAMRTRLPSIASSMAVTEIPDFYCDKGFIQAAASVARESLRSFDSDFYLFSYHGLPERQVKANDPTAQHCLIKDDCCAAIGDANRSCYRAQCYATTRALAAALELTSDQHSVSFQSRLGRTPWIQPFTDHVLPELAERGVRRLAVICPSFTADCLETLEEIGMRAAEQWQELGGTALRLIPAVNSDPRWVSAVVQLLRSA
jgi:ferrochelatase